MNLNIPNQYRDMILDYEIVLHRIRRGVEQLKAIVYLEDGTHLRISEVFVSGSIKKYSYYWLDQHNDLLIGWDNSPHHPEVATFPHHRHRRGRIEMSQQQNLPAVLNYIKFEERMGWKMGHREPATRKDTP